MRASEYELLYNAREKFINDWGNTPGTKKRCTTKLLKTLLLNGPYLLNGRLNEVKKKSLGVGVYEVWLEEVNNGKAKT